MKSKTNISIFVILKALRRSIPLKKDVIHGTLTETPERPPDIHEAPNLAESLGKFS
jgi:hypothetical protein